jgi:hypothetical protein
MDKSVDNIIFINNMSEIQLMGGDVYGPSKLTDDNIPSDVPHLTDVTIRLIVLKYFTPKIEESSNGIILRYVPNRGNVLPEAIIWFHKGKTGFSRKPLSQNVWMMVDCDLKPLHEILHKYFHLNEGDFNITRVTLSTMAYETISEWAKQS